MVIPAAGVIARDCGAPDNVSGHVPSRGDPERRRDHCPIIGSGVILFLDWRSIFIALALVTAIFFLLTLFVLPETDTCRLEQFSVGFLLKAGRCLIMTWDFIVAPLAGSLVLGG